MVSLFGKDVNLETANVYDLYTKGDIDGLMELLNGSSHSQLDSDVLMRILQDTTNSNLVYAIVLKLSSYSTGVVSEITDAIKSNISDNLIHIISYIDEDKDKVRAIYKLLPLLKDYVNATTILWRYVSHSEKGIANNAIAALVEIGETEELVRRGYKQRLIELKLIENDLNEQ